MQVTDNKPQGMMVDTSCVTPMMVDNSHVTPMVSSYDQITHTKVKDDGIKAEFIALFTPKFLGADINFYR